MSLAGTITAQQETNNALAALAKEGNTYALGQLWETNKGLLRSMFWRWYPTHKARADAAGLTVDDFEQEGFFAVKYAAENYDPEKGSFSTYLQYAVQRQIAQMLCSDTGKYITCSDGKQRRVSANPLTYCASLDEPVPGADGEPDAATLAEIIPDPSAQAAFERLEEATEAKQLHDMLEQALGSLPESNAAVIRKHYYGGTSLTAAGAALGLSAQRAQQLERTGLRKLRTNPAVRRWRISYPEQRAGLAWRSSSFASWEAWGSVQERAVEQLERMGAYVIEKIPPAKI